MQIEDQAVTVTGLNAVVPLNGKDYIFYKSISFYAANSTIQTTQKKNKD